MAQEVREGTTEEVMCEHGVQGAQTYREGVADDRRCWQREPWGKDLA